MGKTGAWALPGEGGRGCGDGEEVSGLVRASLGIRGLGGPWASVGKAWA